jgi:hypothetical protein
MVTAATSNDTGTRINTLKRNPRRIPAIKQMNIITMTCAFPNASLRANSIRSIPFQGSLETLAKEWGGDGGN